MKPNLMIIIGLDAVFAVIKEFFLNTQHLKYYDNDSVDEIIERLINVTIIGVLNDAGQLGGKPATVQECYQGNIDHLCFHGIEESIAFQITHQCEMLVMKTILDYFPLLDNKSLVKIIQYSFINKQDLLISVNVQDDQDPNNPNYSYIGLV